MIVVFTKVLEIFAILAIGYGANKKGILPSQASPYLVNLLLVITSPCLIVTSIASKELTQDTFRETMYVFAANAVFFAVGALASMLLMKVLKIEPKEDRGVLSVLMCSVNSGFMGFPITLMIFGQEGLYYMVLCNIVLTFYLYSIAFVQIGNSGGKRTFREAVKPMFNLCILSAIIGVFLLFTGIKIPDTLFELMEMVGDATIPLAMIIVGMLFADSDIKSMIRDRNLLKVTFFSMAVWPAVTFGVMYFIPMPAMPKAIVIFSSAFPSAAVVPALAQQQGKNAKLAAQGVSLTTLVSMITIPVMAIILISVYNL